MNQERKQKVYRLMTVSYGYVDISADSAAEALEDAAFLHGNEVKVWKIWSFW